MAAQFSCEERLFGTAWNSYEGADLPPCNSDRQLQRQAMPYKMTTPTCCTYFEKNTRLVLHEAKDCSLPVLETLVRPPYAQIQIVVSVNSRPVIHKPRRLPVLSQWQLPGIHERPERPERTHKAAQSNSWSGSLSKKGTAHNAQGVPCQIAVLSASSNASSMSSTKYLTVFLVLVWPSTIWMVERLPVVL
jgi:hypothetical protein